MSGECGLILYLLLQILVKSSSIWSHLHHWAIGCDATARILHNGEFKSLPAGRRACQLPDFSLLIITQLMEAQATTKEAFAAEFATMDEFLPPHTAAELKLRVPKAYSAAITKFVKHAHTYQMLPMSLARISEDTGPTFLRAFICVFYPIEAARFGFPITPEQLEKCDTLEVSQYLCQGASAEDTVQMLAMAESDLEVQLCHEQLMRIAIDNHCGALYIAECQRLKEAAGKTRATPDITRAANKLKEAALTNRECFTMGFKEKCNDPAFLSQVLRVAQSGFLQSGTSGPTLPLVQWGVKCDCGNRCHIDCWQITSSLYEFLETHFFHLYVHQMFLEGFFNIHNHNQANAGADYKGAKLNQKVNHTEEMDISNSDVHSKAREIKLSKQVYNADCSARNQEALSAMTK